MTRVRKLVLTLAAVTLVQTSAFAALSGPATPTTPTPTPTHNCKVHCWDGTWYQIWAADSAACNAAYQYYCATSSGTPSGNYSFSSTGYP